MTRTGMFAVAALAALLAAPAAEAAAPRLLMFDGKPLSRPVVLSDWPENLRLVTAWGDGPRATRADLRAGPSLRVALFWGPRWNDYLASGRPLGALRPAQADQFGRFYPAIGGRPALIDLPWAAGAPWPRRVTAAALAILVRHRVPIRLPAGPPPARVRGCETRAEGGRPLPFSLPVDVVVGPVSFRGLRRAADPAVFLSARNGAVYVVKAGVGVRAGRAVTLAIAPRARAWVSLSYAPGSDLRRVSGGVPAVRFQPCPRGVPAFSYRGPVGAVTGFAGGFLLARPGCVPLEVWVEDRREPIRRLVAFGVRRCQG